MKKSVVIGSLFLWLFLGACDPDSCLIEPSYKPVPPKIDNCAKTYNDASVMVRTEGGFGSGIAIAPEYVLTAYHVVSGSRAILIVQNPGDHAVLSMASVYKSFIKKDIVILYVPGANFANYPKIADKLPNIGEPIWSMTTPLDDSNYNTIALGEEGSAYHNEDFPSIDLILSFMRINHGSSGGGVYNEQCELIGLVDMIFKNKLYRTAAFTPLPALRDQIVKYKEPIKDKNIWELHDGLMLKLNTQ